MVKPAGRNTITTRTLPAVSLRAIYSLSVSGVWLHVIGKAHVAGKHEILV